MREYKGTTIFMIKVSDIKTEKFLDNIVRNIESYVKQKGTMPEKLRFSYENYEKVLNAKKVYKENDKYYTFGVKIEV